MSRIALLVLILAPMPARAVTIAWSPVGNPGNAADTASYGNYTGGFGAVGHSYSIGTYDVANSQYVEFLNAKDPTGANTLGLYNSNLSDTTYGGINFTAGNAAGNKYSLIPGDENHPVSYVTWYDAVRFANWLNNGQGNGDTESGSYTLLGGTPIPTNANSITRSPQATVVIPTANEWYKAAYFNSSANSYFLYPTSSNSPPLGQLPPGGNNSANYGDQNGHPTDVGAYAGTKSPSGAFDMGGDVAQWTEGLINGTQRGLRGTPFDFTTSQYMLAPFPADTVVANYAIAPSNALPQIGFRVAQTPEPSSLVLAALGFIGLNAWRLRRR